MKFARRSIFSSSHPTEEKLFQESNSTMPAPTAITVKKKDIPTDNDDEGIILYKSRVLIPNNSHDKSYSDRNSHSTSYNGNAY
jgi:hypothetical protein